MMEDRGGLQSLVKDLRAIADILDRWSTSEGTGTVPAGTPPYKLHEVTDHFSKILNEFMASGVDGHGVYQRLGAIANHLRAAGDALHKE